MDDVQLLEVLDEAVQAVRGALDELEDWGPSGGKQNGGIKRREDTTDGFDSYAAALIRNA